MIGLFARRYANVIVAVHCFAIGIAAAVGNPYSGAGTHHRFKRGNQSARRMLDLNLAIGSVLMDVWLAVCQDNDSLTMEMTVQTLFQALRSPLSRSIIPLIGHAAHQFPHVAENRLKFTALLLAEVGRGRSAQQVAHLHAPVGSHTFSNQHWHSESHDG